MNITITDSIKVGMLMSDLDEQKYIVQQYKKENHELRMTIQELTKCTEDEKYKIKSDKLYDNLKVQLTTIIGKLKSEIIKKDRLISELIKTIDDKNTIINDTNK